MNGTTDAGNIENEMVVIQFCIQHSRAKEIRSCARYFTMFNPDKVDTDGLVNGLKNTLEKALGVSDFLE